MTPPRTRPSSLPARCSPSLARPRSRRPFALRTYHSVNLPPPPPPPPSALEPHLELSGTSTAPSAPLTLSPFLLQFRGALIMIAMGMADDHLSSGSPAPFNLSPPDLAPSPSAPQYIRVGHACPPLPPPAPRSAPPPPFHSCFLSIANRSMASRRMLDKNLTNSVDEK